MTQSRVTPLSALPREHPEEHALLLELADRAANYVAAHAWCVRVIDIGWGDGVGGVIGVLQVAFEPAPSRAVASPVWVIVGDLPPAYFAASAALSSPRRALEAYCATMRRWATAARAGRSIEAAVPVAVEATPEHAAMLLSRLEFLEQEILPTMS